jgi:hypothetical protein
MVKQATTVVSGCIWGFLFDEAVAYFMVVTSRNETCLFVQLCPTVYDV